MTSRTPTLGTATTTQQQPMTMERFQRMVKALRDMEPEPVGEWMRRQGMPPERWRVILPRDLCDDIASGPLGWPDYVSFSALVAKPVFVRRDLLAQFDRELAK